MTETVTATRLRELLDFDPLTGVFLWKVNRRGNSRAGDVAGKQTTQGYRSIRVDGRDYQAHRLAWLYVHGAWPEQQIDHLNGQRSDNRLANLRDVSGSINQQNRRVASRGKSSPLGVYWIDNNPGNPVPGHWYARITVRRRLVTIGKFSSTEAAHQAYVAAKRQLHAGCTL